MFVADETTQIISNLDDLTVSESLCCSCCNAVFENKTQQRLHYKLDWHRFNLKNRLHGYKSISEDNFNLIANENDTSTSSSLEETYGSKGVIGISNIKNLQNARKKIRKIKKKLETLELKSDSSGVGDIQEDLDINKDNISLLTACRHSKVFFENDAGNIFSIYRCLLHSKKVSIFKILDSKAERAMHACRH